MTTEEQFDQYWQKSGFHIEPGALEGAFREIAWKAFEAGYEYGVLDMEIIRSITNTKRKHNETGTNTCL